MEMKIQNCHNIVKVGIAVRKVGKLGFIWRCSTYRAKHLFRLFADNDCI